MLNRRSFVTISESPSAIAIILVFPPSVLSGMPVTIIENSPWTTVC